MTREITVILKKPDEGPPSRSKKAWKALNELLRSPLFPFVFGASFGTAVLPWLTSVTTSKEVLKLRQQEQQARADAILVAPFISSLNAAEPGKFRASSAALRALNEASKAAHGGDEKSSPLFTGILEAIAVVDNELRPPSAREAITPELTQQINTDAKPATSHEKVILENAFTRLRDTVIYIQITKGSNTQLEIAQNLLSVLRSRSLVAPGIEEIDESKMPDNMQVRFFNESDRSVAISLSEVIKNSTETPAFIVKVNLKAKPGTLEVWFPKHR